jgi:cob(I)alamin adenosyltransferase
MDETKINGMLQELQQQIMLLSTRSATAAGELAVANQRIHTLTEQVEKQKEELLKLTTVNNKGE